MRAEHTASAPLPCEIETAPSPQDNCGKGVSESERDTMTGAEAGVRVSERGRERARPRGTKRACLAPLVVKHQAVPARAQI